MLVTTVNLGAGRPAIGRRLRTQIDDLMQSLPPSNQATPSNHYQALEIDTETKNHKF